MSMNTRGSIGGRAALIAALAAAAMINPANQAAVPPKPRAATRYEQQQDRKRRIRDNNKLRAERRDPSKNVATIEAAAAKRERKADKAIHDATRRDIGYYRAPWQPHPAHDKPTYNELRARG